MYIHFQKEKKLILTELQKIIATLKNNNKSNEGQEGTYKSLNADFELKTCAQMKAEVVRT